MLKPKKAAAVAKLKLRTFPLRFDLISSLQINNKFFPFSREILAMFSIIVFGSRSKSQEVWENQVLLT